MRVYIGITGLSSTGKDTVSALLREVASKSHIASRNYKLSDEIKSELKRRGQEISSVSRAILIQLGNDLRANHGEVCLRIVLSSETKSVRYLMETSPSL